MSGVPLPQVIPPEVKEALERIMRATAALGEAETVLERARADRDDAIVALRRHGWTVDQVSEFTGLSQQAIYKISRRLGARSARTIVEAPDA